MASYNNNEDAPHEPDGVALIWNMKYQKESPEYIFHCQVSRIASSDPLPFSSTGLGLWLNPCKTKFPEKL